MNGTETFNIRKVKGTSHAAVIDSLAVEEPLEIRLCYSTTEGGKKTESLSVTMRTPGQDSELATGFLFTEALIREASDVVDIRPGATNEPGKDFSNVIEVELRAGLVPKLAEQNRYTITTSSCGVCGKSSIEHIHTKSRYEIPKVGQLSAEVSPEVVNQLGDKLVGEQSLFVTTGGIHASGLFDLEGNLKILREDVGRHNALDKMIGASLAKGELPLNQSIVMVSGRASFELLQKSAMAGATVVAAIGAPSSLAVEIAKNFNITLLGFVSDRRFNIYHGMERIKL